MTKKAGVGPASFRASPLIPFAAGFDLGFSVFYAAGRSDVEDARSSMLQ